MKKKNGLEALKRFVAYREGNSVPSLWLLGSFDLASIELACFLHH